MDSGATDNFVNPRFVKRMGLGMVPLERARKIWNIDDTENRLGKITHYVDLQVSTNGQDKEMRFLVTDIGKEDVLLGYPWLSTYEPKFSWRHATIDERMLPIVLRSINPVTRNRKTIIAALEAKKQAIVQELENETTARGASTDMAIAALEGKTTTTTLPTQYKQFAKVFSEEESNRFPPSRPWDHAIDLKKDAPTALNCKVYPMTRPETQALDDYIDEQLGKGYIEPSKSPYASPFFFIKKKDGKLRPVVDYRRLNAITIRNQYPFPSFPTSSPTWEEEYGTPSSTYAGVITTC